MPARTIESLYASLPETGMDTAVSVILKLRGETCDIDCLYCFEKRKEAPGGARISAGQVDRLAKLFGARPVCVELHGGEPLTVGRERMAEILDALAAQPNVKQVSLQTNGVLLDEGWLDLFEAHYPDIRFGISLDGDALGNSWRVDYEGRPTYPRVAKTLTLLGRRGLRAGVISAVTPNVLGRANEVIDHLASFDAVTTVSLVPCFDAAVTRSTMTVGRRTTPSRQLQNAVIGPTGPTWAVTPLQYADFVLEATAHWATSGAFHQFKLEPVISTIRRLKGGQTASCHFSDLKCDHVFTAYPDGRLGTCDELPWPEAKLAQLADIGSEAEIATAQARLPLLQESRSLVAKCVSCAYRTTCGAGCLAVRRRFAQADADDEYCAHRMRLIDGVAALLAQPDHPEGVLCRHWRWRPRHPNSMRHVSAFLARWDDPAAPRTPARLGISPYGNINTVGLPGVHEADDLDPRHPQWQEGIEPRARPIVEALTSGWGAITYDSCGGHSYTGLPDAEPRLLNVSLLPRNREEYAELAARLCRVTARAAAVLPGSSVLELHRGHLTCQTTGTTYSVLDLQLAPAPGSNHHQHFLELDEAASRLGDVLTAPGPGSTEVRCACAGTSMPEGMATP
ncbi:radical SAM protein [Streptomyces sp. NPDC054797]